MVDQRKNDEIDLLELLIKALRFLRANLVIFIVIFSIGLGLGVFHYLTSRKVFENKMIVNSNILTESYIKILFENITRHMDDGDYALVSKQLGTSENTVRKLVSLNVENLRKDAVNDNAERDRFFITAEVSDQGILPELQKAILYYLENNDFVKSRVEQNRKTARQMLAVATKEIADIEAFKLRIISGEFFQSVKGNVMFDPTSVNSKILELTEKKLTYENSLQFSNSVFVIEGFNEFDMQARPKLLKSLLSGAMIGLFGVGVLAFFKIMSKLLRLADSAK
ncbi:MAG TPA: hypothetical protein VK666_13850 [Chryseolinea sp.]|nr:hypothetical protein [Chryseolinea sp.]